MRKTSYVVAFFAVVTTLALNILSARRPDWLIVNNPEVLHSRVTVQYGLTQRCDRQVIVIPGLPEGSRLAYTDYKCRPFPNRATDSCEKTNKTFCMVWSTAGYFTELGVGFGVVACLALLFGVSTHSRRRRIWRAVAGLTALHVLFQLLAFAVVTHLYRLSMFPSFDRARPGTAYVLNTLSWLLGVLVTAGIVTTGISANKGHRWAAGNRAYRPIEG
ncbi:hypothetical protein IEO21_06145 [Rhodonia placenta]|uniref:Uncharacterized protein n=2 Tax=Rhodonia placenta TaxID=104341 RepID=A0A1X6NC66_9APHY|nr:hypothetical protein POSPLADRAFT_1043703 [Postia placenta MAD-698-R-SB12]KAF9812555.1 hypothetical protein IEO21_06145 [Postia placenta]OSX66238.1 hypothetical protein POSPLADRAFT_1043703 [Postia placenta MAD-698-R-SB12]